jgi:hypothetical protein
MTNIARQITKQRSQVGSTSEGAKLLPLTGGIPQTVSVRVDQNSKAWFSSPNQTGEYPGISWSCCGYALVITFIFDQSVPPIEIVELRPETPTFWFSDTYGLDRTRQQACCVPSTPGTYRFHVQLADGLLVDPKIIVSPITV